MESLPRSKIPLSLIDSYAIPDETLKTQKTGHFFIFSVKERRLKFIKKMTIKTENLCSHILCNLAITQQKQAKTCQIAAYKILKFSSEDLNILII